MYTVTSLPLESRTRVIFRRAEFGFLGVIVRTCRQTPRLKGHLSRIGALENFRLARRRLRTSWLIVGIRGELRNVSGLPGRAGWNQSIYRNEPECQRPASRWARRWRPPGAGGCQAIARISVLVGRGRLLALAAGIAQQGVEPLGRRSRGRARTLAVAIA